MVSLIPEFRDYCESNATQTHLRAFLECVDPEGHWISIDDIQCLRNEDPSSFRAAALGFLVAAGHDLCEPFQKALVLVSGRKFEPSDTFVLNDLSLLGCHLGLGRVSAPEEHKWFDRLLDLKLSMGGRHSSFCNALRGKYPGDSQPYIELYLYLEQRQAAVPFVGVHLRPWMLEVMKRPFPYCHDFFRDVIAVKVLNSSIGLILKHLEEKSAKLPLTKADLLALDEVEEQIAKSHLDSAIQIMGGILDQYDSISVHTDHLHLKSRWSSLGSKRRRGTIRGDEESREEGEIREGIISLIQELRGFI